MNDRTQVAGRDQKPAARREADQPSRRMTLTPAVDVFEDSQGITLWADLPGVTKDKLEVKVHDGNLYIEADFDTSKIDANLQDGVLKLTIPRRDEARPRRIEVQTS
jgi:HSP20 family protein